MAHLKGKFQGSGEGLGFSQKNFSETRLARDLGPRGGRISGAIFGQSQNFTNFAKISRLARPRAKCRAARPFFQFFLF